MSPTSPRYRARVCWLAGVVLLSACAGESATPTLMASPPGQSGAVQRDASGQSQETVLHSFGGADGAGPVSNMLADRAGVFYGTTLFGGRGAGTVSS